MRVRVTIIEGIIQRHTSKKRRMHKRELKLSIMPGIKRNYPRYTLIVSFMEFRRQPQRAKAKLQKGCKKRGADDGGRKLVEFIFAAVPIYKRIYTYIFYCDIHIVYKDVSPNCLVKLFYDAIDLRALFDTPEATA